MFEKLGTYRKDIQWIFGVIFIILLMLALLISGVGRFFAPDVAKPALVGMFEDPMRISLSQNYEQAKAWLQSRPPGEPLEIPGIPISGITTGEAAKLDAEGLAAKISDNLARQIYEGKIDSFTPQDRQTIGPFTYLNREIYETLNTIARRAGITAAFFGVFMFLFGRRFGRLSSLGLAFVVASLLPMTVFIYLGKVINNPSGLSNTSGNPQQAAVALAVAKALKPALERAEASLTVFLAVGFLFIFLAGIGWAVYTLITAGTTASDKDATGRETRIIDLQLPYDKVFDFCLASLSEVGGKIKEQDRSSGKIKARTSFRWKGSGETIEFTISAVNRKKTQVQVSSKFNIPAITDLLGTNRQNVEKMSEFLIVQEQN